MSITIQNSTNYLPILLIPIIESYSTLFFYDLSLSTALVFKCKTCGLKFEEKKRLEIHKQVHGRKPKVTEYGSPEFSQDRLRG
jgi:predicted restriction endonuclease